MNDKMRDYLYDEIEKLDNLVSEAFCKEMSSELLKDMGAINKHVRHIKHAMFESSDCPHCHIAGRADEKPLDPPVVRTVNGIVTYTYTWEEWE